MKIKYLGSEAFRVGAKLVEEGDEVEVDDMTAIVLCKSPLWESVKKKKPIKKAKKDD